MSKLKAGYVRADGYVFHCYYKNKDGTPREHWLSAEAWAKKIARRRQVSKESARRCRQRPEVKAAHREYQREYLRKQRAQQPGIFLLRSAKARAKKKGLEFNLELADIVLPEFCPVLGIKLKRTSSSTDASPSIDRIDNALGYVKGNVIIISLRANRIKRDATLEELKKLYNFYKPLLAA